MIVRYYEGENELDWSANIEPWIPTFGATTDYIVKESNIMFLKKIDHELERLYNETIESYSQTEIENEYDNNKQENSNNNITFH